ncbi:MAG: hypothetical protein IT497_00725 [Ottowia sp.]|jgi:hypothetical protein|nr:hypothetical protein [Ottowia sp.]
MPDAITSLSTLTPLAGAGPSLGSNPAALESSYAQLQADITGQQLHSNAIKMQQIEVDKHKEVTDALGKMANENRDSHFKLLNAMTATTKQLQY